MQISDSIKGKVFAQYLGQDFEDHTLEVDQLTCNKISLFFRGAIGIRLVLKPLSLITDEHAIECAKIVMQRHDKHYSKVDYSIELRSDYWIDVRVKAQNEFCPSIVRIESKSVSVMKMAYGEKEKFYADKDLYAPETFTVYQLLQSKGYDLPNYLLGGKTLKEAGLAIYEPLKHPEQANGA